MKTNDYLILDIRNGEEVAFKMLRGSMADVEFEIALHENRLEDEVSAWDCYEVSELDDDGVYQPVARLWASDFALPWWCSRCTGSK